MPRGQDLEKLLRGLSDAGARMMGAAAEALSASVARSVDRGFETGTNINGKRYPKPKGEQHAMEKTDKLRHSYAYEILKSIFLWRVRVTNSAPYAEFLRDGTSTMAPRLHMPRPGDPMPARWDRDAQRSIDRAVKAEGRSLWQR